MPSLNPWPLKSIATKAEINAPTGKLPSCFFCKAALPSSSKKPTQRTIVTITGAKKLSFAASTAGAGIVGASRESHSPHRYGRSAPGCISGSGAEGYWLRASVTEAAA